MRRSFMIFGAAVASSASFLFLACGQSGGSPTSTSGGSGAGATTGSMTNTTGSMTTTSTGGSGSGGSTVSCTGQDAQITDLNNGTIGPKINVKLTGAVAMSNKFLATKSSSDNCIWAVFVSAPGLTETAPYSGTMIESFGTKATKPDGSSKSFCPELGTEPTGDAIPDDIQPGDVVDIIGQTQSFLLSNCAMQDGGIGASVGQNQVIVDAACAIQKTGKATPPTPHVLTGADVAKLGDPNDQDFHGMWGGVQVRLDNVAPQLQSNGIIAFDGFGNFLLQGSNVQVGDTLYYEGYAKADPCHAAPVFNPVDGGIEFNHLDGFNMLAFCTWALEPGDKCAAFSPTPDDCMSATCQQ